MAEKLDAIIAEIKLDNSEVNASVKETQASVSGLGKESVSVGGEMTGSFIKAGIALEGIKLIAGAVTGAIEATINTAKLATQTYLDLAERGGKVQDIQVGFAQNFKDTASSLDKLRKASRGTISDYNLMMTASKAAMLGVSGNAEELGRLMEIAMARGQAMGLSTTEAFENIVTGIGRNSPLILDNLGITTGKYNELVKAIEATGKTLSETEKKELLLKSVMEDSLVPVETTTDAFENLRRIKENLVDTISLKLAPTFAKLANEVIPVLETAITNLTAMFGGWYESNKTFIMDQLDRLASKFSVLKDNLNAIVNPTDSTKQSFNNLANEGLKSVVDFLVGKDGRPGLIDNFKALSDKLGDKSTLDALTNSFIEAGKAFQTFNSSVNWLITNYNSIKKVTDLLNNIMTGGLYGWSQSQIKNPSSMFKLPGFADGVTNFRGGLAKVGENGPEIVNLPKGSSVYNQQQIGSMGGITVINNIDKGVDIDMFSNRLNFQLRGL